MEIQKTNSENLKQKFQNYSNIIFRDASTGATSETAVANKFSDTFNKPFHKLYRLEIGNFWPPPPPLVVFFIPGKW